MHNQHRQQRYQSNSIYVGVANANELQREPKTNHESEHHSLLSTLTGSHD